MKAKQYIYHLAKALRSFEIENVKSLVTGTIYDVHAYKIYSNMCSFASMKLRCPLWGFSEDDILTTLFDNAIESMITTINDSRISPNWLGKIYDIDAFMEFKKMGIHPFGEYNEFHTTLINANFFKKKIIARIINKTDSQVELEIDVKG